MSSPAASASASLAIGVLFDVVGDSLAALAFFDRLDLKPHQDSERRLSLLETVLRF